MEQETLDVCADCYHEAAHMVALEEFGGEGRIRTGRKIYSGSDESTCTGHIQLFRGPTHNLPEAWVIVGLAGVVAELLLEDWHVTSEEAVYRVETAALSKTDAALARGYDIRQLEKTFRLLRERWQHVERYAVNEMQRLRDAS